MALDHAQQVALARLEADLRSQDADLVRRFDLLCGQDRRRSRGTVVVTAAAVTAAIAFWAVWTAGPPAIAVIGICLVLASPLVAVWAVASTGPDRWKAPSPPRPSAHPSHHGRSPRLPHIVRWGTRH